MWAVCMDCEGWRRPKKAGLSGLEWSGMDPWRRWHPGPWEHPEMENMVADDGRTWKARWPESRALWEMLTTRLRR